MDLKLRKPFSMKYAAVQHLQWQYGKILITIALLAFCCSTEKTDEDRILARSNAHRISVAAFSRSYLQKIIYSSLQMKDTPETRKKHLQDMMLRHELAQKARQAHLDTLTGFRIAMKAESCAVIIHGLYEEEIAAELPEIPEQDLQTAFKRMNQERHVRHLVAKSKSEIDQLYEQLKRGRTFQQLARTCFRDSTLANNGGDIGFIKWGDMDLDFEETAYSLNIGQVSAPFQTRFGWHILKLENIRFNPILRENEYQAYKDIIRNRVRHRRLAHRADWRVKELMESKNVIMNVPLIRALEMERRKVRDQQWSLPTDFELPSPPFGGILQRYGEETIATFDGGSWKVKDFAQYLRTLPRGTLDEGVYGAVAKSLRNYFLLQIAEKKRIDKIQSVRSILQEKRDHLLANLYVHMVADTCTFSEADYRQYYEAHRQQFYRDRQMQVLEILLKSQPLAASLVDSLLAGGKDEQLFRRLAKKYTQRTGYQAKEGFLGTITRNDYGDIGKRCFSLNKGDIMGPIKTAEGYSIVMLLDYVPVYAPYEEVKPEVAKKMSQQKVTVTYDKLRKAFLANADIRYDEDLLVNGIYMSERNKRQ